MNIPGMDHYEVRARLYPGLLVLLPVLLGGIALGADEMPVVSTALGVVVAAGGPFVLTSVVRERGNATQTRLFAKWGGPPTTQLLQLTEEGSDLVVERRRARIEKVTGVRLPTKVDLENDPGATREKYAEAVATIRSLTRDQNRFPLVYGENVNYGFARNCRGVRSLGIGTSVLAGAACASAAGLIATDQLGNVSLGLSVAGLAAAAVCCLCWMMLATDGWVRTAAGRYARELFASLDLLDGSS